MNKFFSYLLLINLFTLGGLLQGQTNQYLKGVDKLTIGSTFQLIIKAPYSLTGLVLPDSTDEFTIVKQEVKLNLLQVKYLELTIAVFKTGKITFPALKLLSESPNLKDQYSHAFEVEVKSILSEKDTTLIDIKPLKKYKMQLPYRFYAIVLAALLIIMIIVIVMLLLLRKRKYKESQINRITDNRLPWEKAWDSINALLRQDLIKQNRYIEFHFLVADILREFIEAQYNLPAIERTTYELQHEINSSSDPSLLKDGHLIIRFLKYCDKVKFAKFTPTNDELEAQLKWLKTYFKSFKEMSQNSQGSK